MLKTAAIYARVSTDDQSEKGYSLPSQRDACQAFAEKAGFTQTITLLEDHSGATPIADRPQGARLVGMVKRREVDSVIVYQIDRLSRDIVNLLATIQIWLRAGITVYSLDIGQIKSELDIILVIKGWQGSDERQKIRERCMRGKRAKAQAGKVVGVRAPYGYQHVRDVHGKVETLEPVEETAQIVRLIYQWYVYGDEKGRPLSTSTITRRLSEIGLPTPGELKGYNNRRRDDGIWTRDTIISILTREVYAGIWYYGTSHSREEWIPVEVPAIIDRETWEQAQEQKSRNFELAKRNSKHDYLLSGYIRCGCGFSMGGKIYHSSPRWLYYCCNRRYNRFNGESDTCNARSVRAMAIEFAVWESIVELFRDIIELERLLRIAQEDEQKALDPKQEEFTAILKVIDDTEREAVEIGQALKRAGGIVAKTLEKDVESVNRRYDALCKRRDELIEELKGAKLTDSAIQDALQFAENVRLGTENADYETKRRTFELLMVKVTVEGRRFTVSSFLGEWAGDIPAIVNGAIVKDIC